MHISRLSISSRMRQSLLSSVPFDILSLFNTSNGIMYSVDNLFSDVLGTTTAELGDRVARIDDAIGSNMQQSTLSRRPDFIIQPTELGTQLISNPNFADGTDWVLGTGWSISGGIASKAAGVASNLSQVLTGVTDRSGVVFIDAIMSTTGNLKISLVGDDDTANTWTYNASWSRGDYIAIPYSSSGNITLNIVADASVAVDIKNVYLLGYNNVTQGIPVLSGDGVDNYIQGSTPIVNASAYTLVGLVYNQRCFANSVLWTAGNIVTNQTNGSVMLLRGNNPNIRVVSDGSASNGYTTLSQEPASLIMLEVDSSQPTAATQLRAEDSKVALTGLAAAADPFTSLNNITLPTSTLFAIENGVFDGYGLFYKLLVIDKILTDEEKSGVYSWAYGDSFANCALLGDSTVARLSPSGGHILETHPISDFIAGCLPGGHNISASGDKIADQLALWNASPDKSQLDVVMVQVGQNDANTYALTKTSAQIIADLQNLINTIRSDISSDCKIVLGALTPSRGWLGNSSDAAGAYAHWLAINEAIEGLGVTPITGVDGRVTAKVAGRYWGAMSDIDNFLLEDYKYVINDDVHPNAYGRFYMAQKWREALVATGVMS